MDVWGYGLMGVGINCFEQGNFFNKIIFICVCVCYNPPNLLLKQQCS